MRRAAGAPDRDDSLVAKDVLCQPPGFGVAGGGLLSSASRSARAGRPLGDSGAGHPLGGSEVGHSARRGWNGDCDVALQCAVSRPSGRRGCGGGLGDVDAHRGDPDVSKVLPAQRRARSDAVVCHCHRAAPIPIVCARSARRPGRFRVRHGQSATSAPGVAARPRAPGSVPSRLEPSHAGRQNTIGRNGWVTSRDAHRTGDRTAGDPARTPRRLRGRRDRCGRRAPRGAGCVHTSPDGGADRCARVGPTPRRRPRLGVCERGSAGWRAPGGRPSRTFALRRRQSPRCPGRARGRRPDAPHCDAATPPGAASTEGRSRCDPHSRTLRPVSADARWSAPHCPSPDPQQSWILNGT